MGTSKEDAARLGALAAETAELRERIESQFREREILEKRIDALTKGAGIVAKIVTIADTFPRQLSGDGMGAQATSHPLFKPSEPPRTPEPWWPTSEREPASLVPNAGWACFSLNGKSTKVLGISVCGFKEEKLSGIVDMIAARQRIARDFKPVFLTDSLQFCLFRRYNYVFEYFPHPDKRNGPRSAEDWRTYAAARRDFVMKKWNITEVIQFGPRAFGE